MPQVGLPRVRQDVRRDDGDGPRPQRAGQGDLARLRGGDAGGRLPRGVRLRRGGLAQDQLLHEAQALRGHGPHLAGPRGVAGVHTGCSSTASRSPTLSGNLLLG